MIKRKKLNDPGVISCRGCFYTDNGCKHPKRNNFSTTLGIFELCTYLGCLEVINGKIINYVFIKIKNLNSNIEIL